MALVIEGERGKERGGGVEWRSGGTGGNGTAQSRDGG